MAPRQQLHDLLKELLGSDKVYHQPPPGIQMKYPCITYKRDRIDTEFADGIPYKHLNRYQLTVIDEDPDSLIPDAVAKLPTCSFDRAFSVSGLNHHAFNLYF